LGAALARLAIIPIVIIDIARKIPNSREIDNFVFISCCPPMNILVILFLILFAGKLFCLKAAISDNSNFILESILMELQTGKDKVGGKVYF